MLAARGIHDSIPWANAPSPQLERNMVRFYWRNRAETTVEHWDLNLAAVVEGVAVGACSIQADAFPTRRTVETGSWLGRDYQGQGFAPSGPASDLRRFRRRSHHDARMAGQHSLAARDPITALHRDRHQPQTASRSHRRHGRVLDDSRTMGHRAPGRHSPRGSRGRARTTHARASVDLTTSDEPLARRADDQRVSAGLGLTWSKVRS